MKYSQVVYRGKGWSGSDLSCHWVPRTKVLVKRSTKDFNLETCIWKNLSKSRRFRWKQYFSIVEEYWSKYQRREVLKISNIKVSIYFPLWSRCKCLRTIMGKIKRAFTITWVLNEVMGKDKNVILILGNFIYIIWCMILAWEWPPRMKITWIFKAWYGCYGCWSTCLRMTAYSTRDKKTRSIQARSQTWNLKLSMKTILKFQTSIAVTAFDTGIRALQDARHHLSTQEWNY